MIAPLLTALGVLAPPSDAQQLLDAPDDEPTVQALMAAAEREAETHPARLRSWMNRARLAALAPRVSAGVDRQFGHDESIDLGDGGQRLSTGNDLGWKAEASWDLSRLVFSPDEMRVAREGLRMVELRRELLTQVARLYFERRRLLAQRRLQQRAGTLDAATDLDREARVREIEAILDALSGGAMSRRAGSRR